MNNEEIKSLENFVDEFTTVSTNKNKVGERVSRIVLEVNKHHHTKSCRKYDTSCRFLFPRYPSIKTIIAKPISGVSNEQKTKLLQTFNKILMKVSEVLMDEDAVSEILRTVGESENEDLQTYKINKRRRIELLLAKADVSFEDYEKALSFTRVGYKVVHERDLTEIYINSYNIECIRA